MSITRTGLVAIKRAARAARGGQSRSLSAVDYESAWDEYAKTWRLRNPKLGHIGDEWTGQHAGAAATVQEYSQLIDATFIAPYIGQADSVLEIGVGGGKTAALLLARCAELTCADISAEMLKATRQRLGDERVGYVKVDGVKLSGIQPASADICFCFDTMVHMEPRDIFNYLTQVPALLRGKRLCIFHHNNTLSDLGWQRFLSEWDRNLMGRSGGSFSVMTNELMERFLDHLGYTVLSRDTETIPRDCVWVARAPG
ncbi:MAG TPA: class I SAM-dependent methyltransferase [Streptosporangiaceae bacterium]|jgi:SAM-dependent methyltransferase